MIGIILMFLGYFMTSGTLGASLIGAVSLAQYWFWFTAIVVTILIVGTTILGNLASHDSMQKMAVNVAMGTIGIFALAVQWVQLTVSYYIIENINVNATSFGEISTDAIIGFVGLILIAIFGRMNTSK